MAKSRIVPRLSMDEATGTALAKILRNRAGLVNRARKSFEKRDSASTLHDFRVALRRLQAMLEVFSDYLPRKRMKPHRRALKRAIKLLGPLREDDIIMETLEEFRKGTSSSEQPALLLLTARLKHRRAAATPPAIKKIFARLDRIEITQLPAIVREHSRAAAHEASNTFTEILSKLLESMIAELAEHGGEVLNHPKDIELLHELRIDAKPVRYAMELAADHVPALKDEYLPLQNLVQLLGRIHDVDSVDHCVHEHLEDLDEYNAAMDGPPGKFETRALRTLMRRLRERRKEDIAGCRAILDQWANHPPKDRLHRAFLAPASANTTT